MKETDMAKTTCPDCNGAKPPRAKRCDACKQRLVAAARKQNLDPKQFAPPKPQVCNIQNCHAHCGPQEQQKPEWVQFMDRQTPEVIVRMVIGGILGMKAGQWMQAGPGGHLLVQGTMLIAANDMRGGTSV